MPRFTAQICCLFPVVSDPAPREAASNFIPLVLSRPWCQESAFLPKWLIYAYNSVWVFMCDIWGLEVFHFSNRNFNLPWQACAIFFSSYLKDSFLFWFKICFVSYNKPHATITLLRGHWALAIQAQLHGKFSQCSVEMIWNFSNFEAIN